MTHSEQHAQNVARGHKANISNPETSKENKQNSRQVLEVVEGLSDPNFTASVGSEKADGYDGKEAARCVQNKEESSRPTNEPSKLFEEGEFNDSATNPRERK